MLISRGKERFIKFIRVFIPVSYTHLDVYKRQLLINILTRKVKTKKKSANNIYTTNLKTQKTKNVNNKITQV